MRANLFTACRSAHVTPRSVATRACSSLRIRRSTPTPAAVAQLLQPHRSAQQYLHRHLSCSAARHTTVMSSDDGEDFIVSDGGSDDFVPTSKSKAPKGAAKPKAPAKPKATVAPKKSSVSSTSQAPTKKKPLKKRKSNEGLSDDEMDDSFADASASVSIVVPKNAGNKKSATETYQKITQLEHVLKRPDTYIGSVEMQETKLWVFDKNTNMMAHRMTKYVPGFYKIFDEILVNAADNKVRDPSMSTLKVTINREEGSISVWNNGRGIPIEMHETEKVYVPELIFGHLLTSSNYDDDEDKVTGGRNGYGAKLANIYSTEFVVETADPEGGHKYVQTFSNNMADKSKPKITKYSKKESYTCITFKPDFKRFGMEAGIDDDIEALMMKRVYDMAGTVKDIKVQLNNDKLKVKSFKSYVEMYVSAIKKLNETVDDDAGEESLIGAAADGTVPSSKSKPTILFETLEDKGKVWEVAFAVSDGDARQISFVNNIATIKGGTHVNQIESQIIDRLQEHIKKNKKNAAVQRGVIRQQLCIFVNCQIVNPTFDGQTKETLTLRPSSFGSKFTLSESFGNKIIKSGVLDSVLAISRAKQDKLLKDTGGSKRSRVTGIAKLEDANNAGTRKAKDCTLILTEGDSAKALAVSGLSVVGRDNFGVFPLRGKLLNVREAGTEAILKNAEITNINKIMGFKHGTHYSNVDSLRYGSIMIMTDQDHDGSHIKGLIINFLDHFYPSLLKLPNFLVEFITPIMRVTKDRPKQEFSFFTIPEYETWKELNNAGQGWRIKYFKGLGTSTSQDAKVYFGNMVKHRLPFDTMQPGDRELIDLAFNKKKADDRKDWLARFQQGTFLDHTIDKVPISDFINKELILFSMADNIRSIPSLVDGLKPGQRKVLFGCFKRKLKAEIKVAQLAGYVSEHSAYHHGEQSLTMTIVNLAQDYCGSNNVNILSPNGQFGTRSMGGKDAASARYIFTNVPRITRAIFHPADDALLDYLNDDGQSIEPQWYMPTIPLVLVNGGDGIGTGWSSQIPNYNPRDVVENLRRRMRGQEFVPMKPWYRGFTGEIEQTAPDRFKVSGRLEKKDDKTYEITELPVRYWTTDYKETLEAAVVGSDKVPATLKEYREYHTDTTVHFNVELNAKGQAEVAAKGEEAFFKISRSIATSNMVLFDASGKIKKFSTPEEILEDFYPLRLSYYQKRKASLADALTLDHDRLSNQARFVQMIIKKELNVSNRKRSDIVQELDAKKFTRFPKQVKVKVAADVDDNDEEEEAVGNDNDYDYLLSMAIYSLTKEKVERLLAQRDQKEAELDALLRLTPNDLWNTDLDVFLAEWEAMLDEDDRRLKSSNKSKKGKAAASIKKSAKAGANARKVLKDEDDEDDFMDDDDDDDFVVKAKPKAKTTPRKVSEAVAPKARLPSGAQGKAGTKRSVSGAMLDDDDLERLTAPGGSKGKGAATKVPSSPPRKAPKSAPNTAATAYKIDDSEEDDDKYLVPPKKTVAGGSRAVSGSKKAAPAPASRKPSAAKSKKAIAIASDEEDVTMDDTQDYSSPPPPRATSGRAKAKPVKYAVSEGEDEDDSDY